MAQHFFAEIARSYKQADVQYLKSLVDLKHNFPSTNFNKIAFDYSKTENSYIQDFSVAVLDFWQFFNGNICKQSFERYCALLKSFTELIQNDKETSWQVPILKVIIKNTMMISLELSKDLTKKESNYVLESAADAILSSFRLCASELRVTFERSKKQALLFSANCLFKIYFRMSNLHLCKSIMLAIDTSNIDFSLFPINEQVTYKYYCGWKYLYDFDVPSATQCLEYAYKLCSERHFSNRRLILLLLIPLKMICGQRISTAKIQEYKLYPFATLIDAIEEGNLQSYEFEINKYQSVFVKHGIYLLMLRLKIVCLRNLLKFTHGICENAQIKLHLFFSAFCESLGLQKLDNPDEREYLENSMTCFLISLISMGLVKGYISEKHNTLVLSKINPFPDNVPINLFDN